MCVYVLNRSSLTGFEQRLQYLHSIHQRGITFETMRSSLSNMIKEVEEGAAENKNLQNLQLKD